MLLSHYQYLRISKCDAHTSFSNSLWVGFNRIGRLRDQSADHNGPPTTEGGRGRCGCPQTRLRLVSVSHPLARSFVTSSHRVQQRWLLLHQRSEEFVGASYSGPARHTVMPMLSRASSCCLNPVGLVSTAKRCST